MGRGGARGGEPPNRAFQGRNNPYGVEPMGSANPTQLIVERNVRYILVRPNAGEAPEITAKFHNGLQEIAEAGRLGIPLVFSTDPRHGAGRGGPNIKPVISQWPDQLGLAAARDPELVRQFGQIAARSCAPSASNTCWAQWPMFRPNRAGTVSTELLARTPT